MIHFKCPRCDKPIKSKDEAGGRKSKCPGCGEVIRVPHTAAPSGTAVSESAAIPPIELPTKVATTDRMPPWVLKLIALGIALLALLPLTVGLEGGIVCSWAVPCILAGLLVWLYAGRLAPCSTVDEEATDDDDMALPTPQLPQRLELYGHQGKTVIVDGATIRIIKKGWLLASRREKTFPIRNISSVEVKKPGMAVGFIQFSIAGGAARNSSFTWTGGAFDAVSDENSVVFANQKAYQTALQIKEYVETYQERAPTSVSSVGSAADEIVKLKALMDQGIISPKEFDVKKRRVLES